MARADDFFVETALPERDMLGHEALVHEVAEVLLTSATPLTVMVNGSWGAGKTSFLRALRRHTRELSTQRHERHTAATAWFNPWEHEGAQHIMIPFLNVLREHAYRDDPHRRGAYTPHERSLLADLLWMLVPHELHGSSLLPATLHPHSVRERIKALFDRRSKNDGANQAGPLDKPQPHLSTRVREMFVEYVSAIRANGYERLIIFLDDLDRCRPSLMLKLLDLVKVDLVGAVNEDRDRIAPTLPVVFVFAIDHQTLIRAVREPESPTPSADYSRYLDKIFDLRLSLPRIQPLDVKPLVAQLIDSRRPETIRYLRRMIRLEDPTAVPREALTLETELVAVIQDHHDLRTMRVIRRLINKLMVFRYVRRVEESVAEGLGTALKTARHYDRPAQRSGRGRYHRERHDLWERRNAGFECYGLRAEAARLAIAWHAFGQCWLSTQAMVLRADGLGLRLVLGMWLRLGRKAGKMPKVLRDLHGNDLSGAGIRFFIHEIFMRFNDSDVLLDLASAPEDFTTGATSDPGELDYMLKAMTHHLLRLDTHVRRAPY